MKNETGSMISSCFMGLAVLLVGIFAEPLLMVLGGVIIVTGAIAGFVENRRRRYMSLEAEKSAFAKNQAA